MLDILFEDDYILVINKPAGFMVEPDRNNHPNLLNMVKGYLKRKQEEIYAQHIHRLDRPVSGIILFAVQRLVLRNLSEQFAQRKVKKYYQALTTQQPPEASGVMEHWHRKEKKKAVLYDHQVEFAEKATLSYATEKASDDRVLWKIELQTGKYHQIRAQLASCGCPVIGDVLYGSTESYKENAIALHASQLAFLHPVSGEKMTLESTPDFL